MTYEPLGPGNHGPFTAFCLEHRSVLDDSYLSDSELGEFAPSTTSPTWLAREGEKIIGAASLVMDDYHLRGRRARFRILFASEGGAEVYRRLLEALRPDRSLVDRWFLFVKDGNDDLRTRVEAAGFRLERTSHVLTREALPVGPLDCPQGVSIRAFAFGRDEGSYARIRNEAFATLRGSQTPLTVEEVARIAEEDSHLPGGIFLLEEKGEAVGLVRAGRDRGEEGEGDRLEIGPLAILPGRQGRGLGTLLLRRALAFGIEVGIARAVLSVNAENSPALGLYLREGFIVAEGYSCLSQELA